MRMSSKYVIFDPATDSILCEHYTGEYIVYDTYQEALRESFRNEMVLDINELPGSLRVQVLKELYGNDKQNNKHLSGV